MTATTNPGCEHVPACFHALEKQFSDDVFGLANAWCRHRFDQAVASGEPSEFTDFDEQVMEASWHGPDAVIAEALRQICWAYPAIIARVPAESRWTFADGWLTAWEDAQSRA